MDKINFFQEKSNLKNKFLIWTIVFKNWLKEEVNFKLNNWFDFSDSSIMELLVKKWINISEISFEDTNLIPSSKIDNSYEDLSIIKSKVTTAVRNITLH